MTSCVHAGNTYFSVIFFSLISLMFDGFAEETLTVRPSLLPDTSVWRRDSTCLPEVLMLYSYPPRMDKSKAGDCFSQVARLEGFYKQRDNNMYPAWAYVFPTTILRLPYSLLCATLWCCIVYYPVGLAPEPGRHSLPPLTTTISLQNPACSEAEHDCQMA